MFQQLGPAFRMTLLLTVLTGLIYPGVVTGVCQLLFPSQANGSLIERNGKIIGSKLIGQNFAEPAYFHPRPSAAGANGYDPTASSGSNLGPTSQKLLDRMKASEEQFRKENPTFHGEIPADVLTASGSGLDPEISVANAQAQAQRVAEARRISVDKVQAAIAQASEGRTLGLWGEPRVNVLTLNLQLNKDFPVSR